MNTKAKVKIATDVAMTVLLMLLMAFELIGRMAHEWMGIGMFLLFILHHVLNRKWSKNLLKYPRDSRIHVPAESICLF